MKWVDLVPSDFERLAREEGLCVLPMGSLERHGEHVPFGCDLVVAETIAERAAEKTPCVVFPGWYLAQVHEAACFTGTVNLPQAMAVDVLSRLLDGITRNGFRKIAVINCHGGNDAFLDYFCMSQLDEERAYALYVVNPFGAMSQDEEVRLSRLWSTEIHGHADERETSIYMACRPGKVRLELAGGSVKSLERFSHLRPKGIHNAHWWYAQFPQNVTGTPSAATEEKGRQALDILVGATARALQTVKDDTAAPALQSEFMDRVRSKGVSQARPGSPAAPR
jgi:creatinine amidohydrolase